MPVHEWAQEEGIANEEIEERIDKAADRAMAAKSAQVGPEVMRQIEKSIILRTIDQHWREHLANLDHLRQAVGLRGYAQRDPLNEYKSEAFELFESLLSNLREDVTRQLMLVRFVDDTPAAESQDMPDLPEMHAHHVDLTTGEDELADPGAPRDIAAGPMAGTATQDASAAPARPSSTVRHASADEIDPNDPSTWGKVGRNAPCPCGSGKKFKHCHGRLV